MKYFSLTAVLLVAFMLISTSIPALAGDDAWDARRRTNPGPIFKLGPLGELRSVQSDTGLSEAAILRLLGRNGESASDELALLELLAADGKDVVSDFACSPGDSKDEIVCEQLLNGYRVHDGTVRIRRDKDGIVNWRGRYLLPDSVGGIFEVVEDGDVEEALGQAKGSVRILDAGDRDEPFIAPYETLGWAGETGGVLVRPVRVEDADGHVNLVLISAETKGIVFDASLMRVMRLTHTLKIWQVDSDILLFIIGGLIPDEPTDFYSPTFVISYNPFSLGSFPGTSYSVYRNTYYNYQYWWDRFGQESYDGSGKRMIAWADAGLGTACQGFWMDERDQDLGAPSQTADGYKIFLDPSSGTYKDILGHEFGHGFQSVFGRNHYGYSEGQTGVLEESFADIFGNAFEYYMNNSINNTPADPDWLIGYDQFRGDPDECNKRSMLNPPSFNHPDTFLNYNESETGSTHTNAGIINKSAYLFGEPGWKQHQEVWVYGIPFLDAEQVWHHTIAVNTQLIGYSDFDDYRDALRQSSLALYGSGTEYNAAVDSVRAVGIWDGDFQVGTPASATGVPAAATYQNSGEQYLEFVFYRTSANAVYYYYRLQQTWYGPTSLGVSSDCDPAAVAYNGYLYVFYCGTSNDYVYYKKRNAAGSWTSSYTLSYSGDYATTNQRVAATVANGDLYVVYEVYPTGLLYLRKRTGDGSWSTATNASVISNDGDIGAVTYTIAGVDYIYLFYYSSTTSCIRMRPYNTSTGVFSGSQDAGQDNYKLNAPVFYAQGFRNGLHLMGKEGSDLKYIACYAQDGMGSSGCDYNAEWSKNVTQRPIADATGVAANTNVSDWLDVFYITSNTINWRYKTSR